MVDVRLLTTSLTVATASNRPARISSVLSTRRRSPRPRRSNARGRRRSQRPPGSTLEAASLTARPRRGAPGGHLALGPSPTGLVPPRSRGHRGNSGAVWWTMNSALHRQRRDEQAAVAHDHRERQRPQRVPRQAATCSSPRSPAASSPRRRPSHSPATCATAGSATISTSPALSRSWSTGNTPGLPTQVGELGREAVGRDERRVAVQRGDQVDPVDAEHRRSRRPRRAPPRPHAPPASAPASPAREDHERQQRRDRRLHERPPRPPRRPPGRPGRRASATAAIMKRVMIRSLCAPPSP